MAWSGPNPKPEPWKRVKARRKRQRAKARKTCRAARFAKDGGCCVKCGRPLVLTMAEGDWWNVANIHEVKFRSRGGSAIEVENTMTTCAWCHAKEHGR